MPRKYLIVTVSESEHELVRAQAKFAKCSVSNYLRTKLNLETRFHGRVRKWVEKGVDSSEDKV